MRSVPVPSEKKPKTKTWEIGEIERNGQGVVHLNIGSLDFVRDVTKRSAKSELSDFSRRLREDGFSENATKAGDLRNLFSLGPYNFLQKTVRNKPFLCDIDK